MITSQNATAPKQIRIRCSRVHGLITSQNATAPKLRLYGYTLELGLITSQNATAPKRKLHPFRSTTRLITSQNATAPKQFVRKRNEADESLMESKTPNRVYGLIDQHNNLKSIIYTDKNGLRTKQIDIDGRHGGDAHVHRGYFHNENSPNKKPTGLLSEERKMVERLRRIWDNHKSKS